MPREVTTLEEAQAVIERLQRLYDQLRQELSESRETIAALRGEREGQEREDTTHKLDLRRGVADLRGAHQEALDEVAFLRGKVGDLERSLTETQEAAELLREALRLQTSASMTTIERLEATIVELRDREVVRAAFDPRADFSLEMSTPTGRDVVLPDEPTIPGDLPTDLALASRPAEAEGVDEEGDDEDAVATAAFDLSRHDNSKAR